MFLTHVRRFGNRGWCLVLILPALVFMLAGGLEGAPPDNPAHDPGVRGGAPGGGMPIAGLNPSESQFFTDGQNDFQIIDSVSGTVENTGSGLGPRFNAESCSQCHAQPALGGSSPFVNPQVADATDQGARNQVPAFITSSGPVREARFPMTLDLQHVDGSVHSLYTITGRVDAGGCNIQQDNFAQAAQENDLVFRIPTPLYGTGLIEAIPDAAILANLNGNQQQKHALGIFGRTNTNVNDGTITRFGWKAQNKSLMLFTAEAYNVEVGVTNEIFDTERDLTAGCQFNPTPEDHTNVDRELPSDIVHFTYFMRFLDQPRPGPTTPSTQHGSQIFSQLGCALCHTVSFTTGQSSTMALSNIQAKLYSDLLLHHMGPGLADNISQGVAGGDEFRTAPLWGLGQRIFFMHDGRTTDLVQAIQAHSSSANQQFPASEANAVVNNYSHLPTQSQQDLLNFLRSL
jgi:CxxC motif-containing protein (DUF1111 family)